MRSPICAFIELTAISMLTSSSIGGGVLFFVDLLAIASSFARKLDLPSRRPSGGTNPRGQRTPETGGFARRGDLKPQAGQALNLIINSVPVMHIRDGIPTLRERIGRDDIIDERHGGE